MAMMSRSSATNCWRRCQCSKHYSRWLRSGVLGSADEATDVDSGYFSKLWNNEYELHL